MKWKLLIAVVVLMFAGNACADDAFLEFARKMRDAFVRPSFSQTNCFTDVDLSMLRQQIASGEAQERIRTDEDFGPVVEKVRSRTAQWPTWNSVWALVRPTWRQMGFIDSQGRGQTEAGHQADQLVLNLVVQEVARAAARPADPPKIGDTIRALHNGTPLKVGDAVVATVDAGREMEVIRVSAPWVGVGVVQGDRRVYGWVLQDHCTVVPVGTRRPADFGDR